MTHIQRRDFVKYSAVSGLVLSAAGLFPTQVLANWPATAFATEGLDEAIAKLFPNEKINLSNKLSIKTPEIAQNGAEVPIKVDAKLPGVESISVFVDKNPRPLAASFKLYSMKRPHIRTRIKIRESANVVAVVRANGKLYMAKRPVKVTIGGCGG